MQIQRRKLLRKIDDLLDAPVDVLLHLQLLEVLVKSSHLHLQLLKMNVALSHLRFDAAFPEAERALF